MRQVLHLRTSAGPHRVPKSKALQLMRRKHVLDVIDGRRQLEGDPAIGLGIERRIIQEELDELEAVASETGPPEWLKQRR